MPLPVSPYYVKNLDKTSEMVGKDILPPPLNINLKKRYPLSVQQQPPLTSPPSEILPSPSPLPCAEPESLGNDQTESKENSLEASADHQEEERGEIPPLQVFGKDMIEGKIESRWRTFKSQRAGIVVKAPGQLHLPIREIQ